MRDEVKNINKKCVFNGPYAGRDLYITMFQEPERNFVVTHYADIKPVAYFTGRETELLELHQEIEEKSKSVLICGMGGIGKTHIIRKLFEEYYIKHGRGINVPFRHIGYIEYNGDMGTSLQKCLKYKRQENRELDQEAAWQELEYLASDGSILLFVDNINKSMSEDPGLQRLNSIPGSIVLTSRQVSFSDQFMPYKIGFLGTEQCKEIYEKIRFKNSGTKVDQDEVQDLTYIIEKLAGKHTITVEFLAHLAWTKSWNVKKLRTELEEKGFYLEFHKNGEFVNIQNSYEVLYDLSELMVAEQNILEAFSVFPYLPLTDKLCNQWLLSDAGVSEKDDIFIGLYQKGWLQFDVVQESYTLHPVFAKFIYEKCKPEIKNHLGLIQSCKNSLEIPEDGSIFECQICIPFVESIIEKLYMEKWEEIGLIDHLAYLMRYMAEYKKAEQLYKKVIKIRQEVMEDNDQSVAMDYINLAVVYESQGKYEKAEILIKKALKLLNDIDKDNQSELVAGCYNNLASVYAKQKKYEEAKKLFEESLRIRKNMPEENLLSIADSYNNLASIYAEQRKFEEAENLYEVSLKIRKNMLGKFHPNIADGYNNLALLYTEQEKYEKAEELYIKSLEIRKCAQGENNRNLVIYYNNLLSLYEKQEKYEKAEEILEKILMIFKNSMEEDPLKVAIYYDELAYVCVRQKKYGKAEVLLEDSLLIRKNFLDEKHITLATNYNNLALVYNEKGEYEKVLDYYFMAYEILMNQLGITHSNTQFVYKNMKDIYIKQNPEYDFEQWLEKRLRKSKRSSPN